MQRQTVCKLVINSVLWDWHVPKTNLRLSISNILGTIMIQNLRRHRRDGMKNIFILRAHTKVIACSFIIGSSKRYCVLASRKVIACSRDSYIGCSKATVCSRKSYIITHKLPCAHVKFTFLRKSYRLLM